MGDYLTKPFDRADLNRLLDRWCGDKGRTEAGEPGDGRPLKSYMVLRGVLR